MRKPTSCFNRSHQAGETASAAGPSDLGRDIQVKWFVGRPRSADDAFIGSPPLTTMSWPGVHLREWTNFGSPRGESGWAFQIG